jgi:hypothetical protein
MGWLPDWPPMRPLLLDDAVIWQGRSYVVKGIDPMNVPDRTASLEDIQTDQRVRVPVDEIAPPIN